MIHIVLYQPEIPQNTGNIIRTAMATGSVLHLIKPYGDIYLVFGKESTGIAKNILKQNLQHCIRLPMRENARSLNLSNTVAIMVYEVLRQLGYPNLSKVEVIKGEDFLTDNQFEQDY